MYKVAVCDSSKKSCIQLVNLFDKWQTQENVRFSVHRYSTAKNFVNALQGEYNQFGLVFIETDLIDASGIDVIRDLRAGGFSAPVVFISHNSGSALYGYRAYPLDYLMKPIVELELFESLKQAHSLFNATKVIVPVKSEDLIVEARDILFIEHNNRSLFVKMRSGNILESNSTLKEMEARLPSSFFVRCHRSFIVNLAEVNGISAKNLTIPEDVPLPIGRFYHESTLKALEQFVNTGH